MTLPASNAFQIGQKVTIIGTLIPLHDTSEDPDGDVFHNEPGVVVDQLVDDSHHHLVYVPRTRSVYPCVTADLADVDPAAPPVINGFGLYWVQERDEVYAARSLKEARAYVEGLIRASIPADEVGEVQHDMTGMDGHGGFTTLYETFRAMTVTEPVQVWTAYAG